MASGTAGTATTGPENPLREYTGDEQAEIKRAQVASEQAWRAWKRARDAGEPADRVGELEDKAKSAMDYERSVQDLCD